jgi:hypothetical protein
MSELNSVLANGVWAFHLAIVLFVLFAPFSNYVPILFLHVLLGITLVVHWWGNSNVCALSVLEAKLRGLDYTESFTHRFVGPMYDISGTTWSTICYVIVAITMAISIYRITQTDRWQMMKECFSTRKEELLLKNGKLTLMDNLKIYTECYQTLLQ